jgi:hypothetical protein
MINAISHFFQNLHAQGNAIFYGVTVPFCLINTLPLIALCFVPRRKIREMIILAVCALDLALVVTITFLIRHLIFDVLLDTWVHLSIIQRGIEHGLFAPDSFYLNVPGTSPFYSLIDILIILISKITKIVPLEIWEYASGLLVVVILFFSFRWHKKLLQNRVFGFYGGLIFLICSSGWWYYAVYPRNFALIFFFLSHIFLLQHIKRKGYRPLIWSGIFLGLCISSHLFSGVQCILSMTVFIICSALVDRLHKKHIPVRTFFSYFLFIPIGLIISLPWLINSLNNIITRTEFSAMHYKYLFIEFKIPLTGLSYRVLPPGYLIGEFPLIIWLLAGAGFAISGYRIIKGNYKIFHVFAASTALIAPVLLFTPLYSLFVHTFGSFMPLRLASALPVPAFTAILIKEMADRLKRMSASKCYVKYLAKIAVTVFMFLLLLVIVTPIITEKHYQYLIREQGLSPVGIWANDFKDLKKDLKDHVVLTDLCTSYFLPYFTSAYVVSITPEHGSPYINHEKRMHDMSAMLNVKTNTNDRLTLLNKYNADFVLVNQRTKILHYGGWHWIEDYYSDTTVMIFDTTKYLQKIYRYQGVDVYRVDRGQGAK